MRSALGALGGAAGVCGELAALVSVASFAFNCLGASLEVSESVAI